MSIAEWKCQYNHESQESLSPPDVVIYAGGSPKRQDIIRQVFSLVPVFCLSGGIEEDIPEVDQIAHGKIEHVLSNLPTDINPNSQNLLIIAADTRTRTLRPNDTSVNMQSQGKPQSEAVVQESFRLMQEAVIRHNLYPFYFVDTATGFVHFPTNTKRFKTQTTAVKLNERQVAQLATDQGFADYLGLFQEFYRSEPYKKSGYKAMSLFDLSAGISLPVLFRMGAVDNINGVHVSDKEFSQIFKKAMYNVAVGVHPEVLESIAVDAQRTIDNWPWLNQVTEFCLQGY